jgi:hypothetical protein
MRASFLLALVLVGTLALSGCSSKNDTSSSTTSGTGTGSGTTGGTHTGTGTGGPGTNTTLPPNIPPMIMLTVTNATGVATNVTLVDDDAKTLGSLTFDATGSMDPDGDGLSAIAISAQDSNRTYPPGVLYAAGKFSKITYKFDRPGIVNITVSGIDVRGNLTTIKTQAFVDERQAVTSRQFAIPFGSTTAVKADSCQGPSGQAAADNVAYDLENFNVHKGAKYAVVTLKAGSGQFAVCDPDGHAISNVGGSGTPAETTAAMPPPTGTKSYQVGMVGTDTTPDAKFTVTVVVHYEPKGAK